MRRNGASPNKRRPLNELPCGKASGGNAAWSYAAMGSVLPARKPAEPGLSAVLCCFASRDGASLNKRRPLYELPRGKASAGNASWLSAERESASINFIRRKAPSLPTLASEQPLARGLRQFRPQERPSRRSAPLRTASSRLKKNHPA